MARVAETGPTARLKQLEAALDKAKKLPAGTVLTSTPMADILGVRWPTLRRWLDEIPGLAEAEGVRLGGNGIEYGFDPRKVIPFLIQHFEGLEKASRDRAQRITKAITGKQPEPEAESFNLDEMLKMLRASTLLQQQRERQGLLIEADQAAALFAEYHSTIQQAALRAGQEQDALGLWSPEIRESFEDAVRRILLAIERAGEKVLTSLRRQEGQT